MTLSKTRQRRQRHKGTAVATTKEQQESEIIDSVYRAMMRAIGMAIPVDAPPGLDGGVVVFTASGMVACKFLKEHFSKDVAHALIDRWANGAHESVDAPNSLST